MKTHYLTFGKSWRSTSITISATHHNEVQISSLGQQFFRIGMFHSLELDGEIIRYFRQLQCRRKILKVAISIEPAYNDVRLTT